MRGRAWPGRFWRGACNRGVSAQAWRVRGCMCGGVRGARRGRRRSTQRLALGVCFCGGRASGESTLALSLFSRPVPQNTHTHQCPSSPSPAPARPLASAGPSSPPRPGPRLLPPSLAGRLRPRWPPSRSPSRRPPGVMGYRQRTPLACTCRPLDRHPCGRVALERSAPP